MALDEAIEAWARPRASASRRLAAIATDSRPFVIALGIAMVLYVALDLWLTRGTTLFIDEVKLFMNNRGLDPNTLLAPINGHLILVRTLLYALAFKLFGAQTSFVIGRLVEAASTVVLAGLVFVFLRRRIGPAAALPPALLVLFLGSCWEINYSISGIDDVWALASGIGALLLLDRETQRADAAACALLTVSVASFTTGTAFLVCSFFLLALRHELRRRVWVVLVPLALYAAWLLWVRLVYVPAHGNDQQISLSNLLLFPSMVSQLAAAAAGALAGLNYNFTATDPFTIVFSTASPYGALLAAAAIAALVWRLQRVRSPMVWALLAALLTYWLEITISSTGNRDPTVVRYVFFGGVIGLLLTGELVRVRVTSRAILLAIYAVTALALLGNVARLRQGMEFYRTFGTAMRAQMAAMELARPSEQPSFNTTLGSPPFPFFTITAAPYLEAVHHNGSPAYSEQQLLHQSETLRNITDSVLVAALRISVIPQPAGVPVAGCLRQAGRPGSALTVFVRPPGVSLNSASGAGLSMSQFGTSSSVPVGTLPQGRPVELRVPPDLSSRPWRVVINPPGEVTTCQLRSS